jgi:hypothetical protein
VTFALSDTSGGDHRVQFCRASLQEKIKDRWKCDAPRTTIPSNLFIKPSTTGPKHLLRQISSVKEATITVNRAISNKNQVRQLKAVIEAGSTPSTLQPSPFNPQPSPFNPQPSPSTFSLQTSFLDSIPHTLHPSTLNPQP